MENITKIIFNRNYCYFKPTYMFSSRDRSGQEKKYKIQLSPVI